MRPVLLIQGQVRSFVRPSGDASNQRSEDRITSRAPIRFRFSSPHASPLRQREETNSNYLLTCMCVHKVSCSRQKPNIPVIEISRSTYTSLHTHTHRVSQTFNICTPDMCHFARVRKAKRFRPACCLKDSIAYKLRHTSPNFPYMWLGVFHCRSVGCDIMLLLITCQS